MIELPGYAAGEPLPAQAQALTDVLASAVREETAGAECVLLGHSSGGYVAAAVAARLRAIGTPTAGLVLLDSSAPPAAPGLAAAPAAGPAPDVAGRSARDWLTALHDALLAAENRPGEPHDDWWVTARARYLELGLHLIRDGAPTLYVQAADSLVPQTGAAAGHDSAGDSILRVPGDHFSMLRGENARTTAAAVEKWLDAIRWKIPLHRR